MDKARLLWGFCALLGCHHAVAVARAAPASPVAKYEVEIRPSATELFIAGQAQITFTQTQAVHLPLHDMQVQEMRVDGHPWPAPVGATIDVPHARVLAITYTVRPSAGLTRSGNVLYSEFSTCQWMPCFEEPSVRAPVDMTIVVAPHLQVAATGQLREKLPRGALMAWHFSLDTAYPAYLYGFAVGTFTRQTLQHHTSQHGDVELLALGDGVSEDKLRVLLSETAKMLDFFSQRAGITYPLPSYTQVLVEGGAAQEMAGMSVLGLDSLDDVLDAPHRPAAATGSEPPVDDWIVAHELSHAWWGNLLTCADWDEFWLNESFAVFMSAAWKEFRWGRAGYDTEMARATARWKGPKAQGKDLPLSRPQGLRAFTYGKGTVFLDALRQQMGDERFWHGIAAYTQRNAGRSVTSHDFEAAMSEDGELSAAFRKWVYPP